MIDRNTMQSLLEKMEQSAEESLQRDAAFHRALRALKSEIDSDPVVQATVGQLQSAGRSVFKSFVPHIKIRVRNEDGIFALPRPAETAVGPGIEKVSSLIQELRNAASTVIKSSRHYHDLNGIVNEVVATSSRFEGIACQIESAGYEVLICLDLSAYAQVQGMARPSQHRRKPNAGVYREEPMTIPLTGSDRKFLAGLKIKIDPEPLGT
jgi:hypothetical protein